MPTFTVKSSCLRHISSIINVKMIERCCAEGGVFEGDFAKKINCYFPNRKLYFFDIPDGEDAIF